MSELTMRVCPWCMLECRPEQFRQTFKALVSKDMVITVTNLACHRHNGIGSLEMAEKLDGVIVETETEEPAPKIKERWTQRWRTPGDRDEHTRMDG